MGHAKTKRERMEQMESFLQRAYSKGGASVFDVERELGFDHSTAHRYLKELDGVIEVERGKYAINPQSALSNVRLNTSEAIVIYLALRKFIRQTGKATHFMISALQKVIPALRDEALVTLLQNSTSVLAQERPADETYTLIWQRLLEAWRERWVVRIDYQKQGSDQSEPHDIEPYLFEPQLLGDGLYVIAWSRTRNALRTFKPDRILSAQVLPIKFEPRLDLTVEQLLRHSWGIWYGEQPITVELLFKAGVPAQRVQETVFLPTEKKVLLEDGSLYWRADVVGWIEILSWIRGWGDGVQVLAPEDLRQRVVQDLQKTLKQYGL